MTKLEEVQQSLQFKYGGDDPRNLDKNIQWLLDQVKLLNAEKDRFLKIFKLIDEGLSKGKTIRANSEIHAATKLVLSMIEGH